MRWNWQLPDWPEFRFDAERIRASEEQFLKGSGVVVGALHHLDANERDGLTIELTGLHPSAAFFAILYRRSEC